MSTKLSLSIEWNDSKVYNDKYENIFFWKGENI